MPGPLDGFRIVDVTAMLTGPMATMLLADQGAEVIKVEPPGVGDVVRYLGTAKGGISAFFSGCNRGKRSLALNLREERGREILLKLVKQADVFVQNFRPGVVERLGIDEDALRAVRPDLVYVSMNAFGTVGPYAAKPAFDHILQGLTGAALQQGAGDGGTRPQFVRNAFCDKVTGYTAAQGITAALLARERGAGGQHLRLSMLDAALAFLWPDMMTNQTLLDEDVTPLPALAESYRFIETADGYIAIAAVTDAQWYGLFRAVERPDLAEDPRFATIAARMSHIPALLEELGDGKVELSTEALLTRLEAEDVPCGPILSLDEVADHPQVRANESLVERRVPLQGRLRTPTPDCPDRSARRRSIPGGSPRQRRARRRAARSPPRTRRLPRRRRRPTPPASRRER